MKTNATEENKTTRIDKSKAPSASPFGSCISEHGPVELARAYVLENRTIWIDDQPPIESLSLVGESVTARRHDDRFGHANETFDIAKFVSSSGEEVDIDTNFLIVGGIVGIYWRETYQHQSYRQGVVLLNARGLVRYCEGRGGTDSAD